MRGEPAWLDLYGRAGAAVLEGVLSGLGRTCRFEVGGPAPPAGQGVIECLWHRHHLAYSLWMFARGVSRATFFHPKPYLAPWHVLARRHGWVAVRGSAGHGGRGASARLVELLRAGTSMFVCPDGPRGPPEVLKRGVLHMAREAQVPIVPLRFACTPALRLPTWDGKYVPAPGARVAVEYGAPIRVGEDLEASAEEVRREMG